MGKFENILTFEAALQQSKELQEKFASAKARIAESGEAASDAELLVKAAAEVGYTLTVEELERAIAQAQEVNEEELAKVAGGIGDNANPDDAVMTKGDFITFGSYVTFGTYECAAGFISYLAL